MVFEFLFNRKKEKTFYDNFVHQIFADMEMIPGGSFLMGTNDGESDERPIHNVMIDPFYISKIPVTQRIWTALMNTEPWKNKEYVKEGDNYPAVNINWYEAKEFIKKLNDVSKKEFRLPTEAEWEYACRAGTTTKFSHGSFKVNLPLFAWYYENAFKKCEMYPHAVGTRAPNRWGIYDMMGNISEWCTDWYSKNYYGKSPVQNPQGPMYGTSKVVRGGDWSRMDYFLRVTSRCYYSPHYKDNNIGFRLAGDIVSKDGKANHVEVIDA